VLNIGQDAYWVVFDQIIHLLDRQISCGLAAIRPGGFHVLGADG
jgi:hypothetical protein